MKRLLFVLLSLQLAIASTTWAASTKKTAKKPIAQSKKTQAKTKAKKKTPPKKTTSNSSTRDDFGAPTETVAPPPPAIVTPPPSFTDAERSNRHKIEPPPKSDATWWFGPRLAFWQESINATRGSNKATFPSQFMGAFISASRRGKIGKSVRWIYALGFEAGLGTVKSSSSNPAFADRLKNQPWLGVGVNPGVIYRGTSVTDIYMSVPIMYRQTFWTLDDSTLSMGRDQSHSAGLSVLTANRLSTSTTFIAGLAHQIQWKATQWLIGFDYNF